MAILTAEYPPTSGDAFICGHSVSKNPEITRRLIGYCPQFDAHFQNMTGREHVELYAAIKGVPLSSIRNAAVAKLLEVGLTESDYDRLSAAYSGGMKRKLSVACATIGNPKVSAIIVLHVCAPCSCC
jgi:ABC-type multidrug transport system ATPase subunit